MTASVAPGRIEPRQAREISAQAQVAAWARGRRRERYALCCWAARLERGLLSARGLAGPRARVVVGRTLLLLVGHALLLLAGHSLRAHCYCWAPGYIVLDRAKMHSCS